MARLGDVAVEEVKEREERIEIGDSQGFKFTSVC